MRLLRTLDFDALTPEKQQTLLLRRAVRAVVFDDKENVSLLHVTKLGYYKIPGGGIEEGEDISIALKRECLEEIGCDIEIGQEIGMTEEYRRAYNIHQESYCYFARVVGAKGSPAFTQQESTDGFRVMWVPLPEAIQLVESSNTEDYQGSFIVPRELVFLREASILLQHTL